jgi:hypothetical protein
MSVSTEASCVPSIQMFTLRLSEYSREESRREPAAPARIADPFARDAPTRCADRYSSREAHVITSEPSWT